MTREELGINDWLELIKEDKNLNGAYICISQYIYLVEKENQETITKFDTQQKEFIKYLEEKEKQFDRIGDPINAGACCGILQKYKKIIGGK